MRYLAKFLMLVLLLLPVSVWAAGSCSVKSQQDMAITMKITTYQPSQTYELKFKKTGGGKEEVLVWSTSNANSPVIYEDTLVAGKSYDLRISYTDNNSTFIYYRKEAQSSVWQEVGSAQKDLDNGNADLTVVGNADLDCKFDDEVPETPTELPDICEIVPDTLQSNFYTNAGTVFGNLATTPGVGSQIHLPSDDTLMSFGSTFSQDCYYPSSSGSTACRVDPNKTIAGYPLTLEDKFTGQNLVIAENTTTTLDGGEYWFDSITFSGVNASLNVDGKTVIHYKQVNIPSTSSSTAIYINNNGDPKDLLLMGHGSNSAWNTTSNSAQIIAYAHFYIDNQAAQGFTLGGSNSQIYGGITANAVSLGGPNNVINGEGGCGDVEPGPDPTPIDICEYFPTNIQNNYYLNSSPPSLGQVSNTYGINVIGGNSSTGNRVYLDSDAALAFPSSMTNDFAEQNATESGCYYTEGGKYGYNDDQKDDPVNNRHSDPDLIRECLFDASANVFGGTPPIPETMTEQFQSDEATNPVIFGQNDPAGVKTISPGSYGSFEFNSSGQTLELEPGEYWVNTINFKQNANRSSITTSDPSGQVILHYRQVKFNGFNNIYFNALTSRDQTQFPSSDFLDPNRLIMIGHGSDSGLTVDVDNVFINALWYVSPSAAAPGINVTTAGQRVQFYGAFSAPGVTLNGESYNFFYPSDLNNCSTPTPNETYTIDVTPDQGYYLTCDAPEMTFTVRDENGEIATSYTGNINATFPTGLVPNNSDIQQGSVIDSDNNIYQPSQGQVVVPVSASQYMQFSVEGQLTDDLAQSDTGSIEFVPFAFYADDQYVIANKPQNITVKALACDSENHDRVAVNYTGTPSVSSSLQEPSNGVGELTFSPEFSDGNDGEVNTDLTFTDAGKLSVTLTDDNFDCTGYEGCPIGENGESDGVMKGNFTVYSRPWTFAICDPDGSAMNGNISDASTQAFKAAGDEFSLSIRPLRWVSGSTDPVLGSENINVSVFCNSPITQNFTLSQAPQVTIQLDHNLAQPAVDIGGQPGALSGITTVASIDNQSSGANAYYNFSQLSWSEVGVIEIQADTLESYYGMNINQGYREIGRFYPHHFKLENDNVWNYSGGHSGFAYMNQPIPMDYRVKAKSAMDSDTENYGYFTNSLKADFVVEAIEREIVFGAGVDGESLNNRLSSGENQSSNNWDKATYTFNSNDFMFLKFSVNADPYLTTPDGPYKRDNALFGVGVDADNATYENQDEVNFESEFVDTNTFTAEDSLDGIAVSFFHQPEFRYGRMVLDAVSGPIGGPISVPLRVEYWDGASFVVNSDDNGSQFKTDVYYVMSNVDNSSAKLNSSASSSFITVANGKSSRVQAEQITAQREQVRLFLRQGNNSSGFGNNSEPEADDSLNATNDGWKNSEDIEQPWLQFNWRDKGDEDPSTVVNFGAYRGNDRIIFRGESNLTGG